MNVGRVESRGGVTITEIRDMPWHWWTFSGADGVLFCGEFNQALWLLHQVANRASARRWLTQQLRDMAGRVGVEYTSTQHEETDERNRS